MLAFAYLAHKVLFSRNKYWLLQQVAQWATIAHLRANIMFGDTIFYNAQRQVTLNLKQRSDLDSNTRYYASSAYLQVLVNLN